MLSTHATNKYTWTACFRNQQVVTGAITFPVDWSLTLSFGSERIAKEVKITDPEEIAVYLARLTAQKEGEIVSISVQEMGDDKVR